MRQRVLPSTALLQLAETQKGIVTSEQALSHDLGKHSLARLIRTEWQPLSRGIYYTRPGDPSWLALAWTGVLLGRPGARLGFDAAGFVHGLVREQPARITILQGEGHRTEDRSPWQFRREAAGVRASSIGDPPRTRNDDTILDL